MNLHRKQAEINQVPVWIEAYPPLIEEAPYWKEPPAFVSTRMRLIKVPEKLKMEQIEDQPKGTQRTRIKPRKVPTSN